MAGCVNGLRRYAPREAADGRPAVRLGFFYISIFLIMGVHLPYWPVWLSGRGLDAGQIGTIMALSLVLRVVVGPIFALAADRIGRRKGPLILLAAATLAAFALFAGVHAFWPILLVSLLVSALFPSMMPLLDTLTLQRAPRDGFDYGRVRLWGSASFIAASTIGGWLLARAGGTAPILSMILAACALTLMAAFLLPPDSRQGGNSNSSGRYIGAAALRLCVNRKFLLFVAAAASIQAGHAVYYAFGTLNWQGAGVDDGTIGILWAIGVIAEIILFVFAARIVARLGPALLIALGGGAGVLRWSVTALDPGLATLVFMQCLHAFTFGATHLGAMHFLNRAAPPEVAATAQSVYAALSAGLVIGGVTYMSGFAYAEFGGQAYFGMAVICLIGGLCGLWLARIWDGGVLRSV